MANQMGDPTCQTCGVGTRDLRPKLSRPTGATPVLVLEVETPQRRKRELCEP